MDAILADFRADPATPVQVMAVRLLGAALLCGAIGLERKLRDHDAGLRTNMLIGVAAATFALITAQIIASVDTRSGVFGLDLFRFVSAVTSGVAFLAAGAIVFSKGPVHGLTTGTSMWLSSPIGLAAGSGYGAIAGAASVMGVVVLVGLRTIERGTKGATGREKESEPETKGETEA